VIPEAAITHWRNLAPWAQDAQVEQDLILSRALVEIFQEPVLSESLLLRGGTALHKLFISPARRYSEDIDLVQVAAGPIGPILNAIPSRLDPLLGEPRREINPGNVTLRYRMASEIPPVVPLRLKLEINTREHFVVFGVVTWTHGVRSPWFEGEATVRTFALEELLGTKLRALFQRRKGRDLFDLWTGLETRRVDPRRIVEAFRAYMKAEGARVSRAVFEKNLAAKIRSRAFNDDLRPLLAPEVRYDVPAAARAVSEQLLALLLGEPPARAAGRSMIGQCRGSSTSWRAPWPPRSAAATRRSRRERQGRPSACCSSGRWRRGPGGGRRRPESLSSSSVRWRRAGWRGESA
jgi:predicted nucleotidyltransferase component of viral defense system